MGDVPDNRIAMGLGCISVHCASDFNSPRLSWRTLRHIPGMAATAYTAPTYLGKRVGDSIVLANIFYVTL